MEYCAWCGSPVDKVSYAPCPRCGKPANGAPPPAVPAKTGGGNTALIIVIVVVVVLLVVAFLGIVAAIAIPNLLTAQQRAKQHRTMADMRSLASAIEAYGSDNNRYPASLDALSPRYIKTVPAADGWGRRFEYQCINDQLGNCTGYVLASAGKDGLREPALTRGPTRNFDCDIVYSNGEFTEYPDGVQH